MAKYRVEFINKQLQQVVATGDNETVSDHFTEETTGEQLSAIIEAENETEAREKALRLEEELRTRQTKPEVEQRNKEH